MAGQKGQSMVEFVLTVPILMLLVFGMIYSGFIYADYLQYNNAARDIARDIAIRSEENRERLMSDLNSQSFQARYVRPLTNLYGASFFVQPKDANGAEAGSFASAGVEAVTVTVSFQRQSTDGIVPVFARGVLPESLPSIEYTMRLEEDPQQQDPNAMDPNQH